ncbi:MAG: hypothetical protein IJ523_06685 [Succinivibrionaceae bacterium]|nr:hypothetical protein [Succinivibrionaceae bacterium]
MIRRPSLLNASLQEVERLQPTSGSVTLKMVGSSEATLTLAEDAPLVGIHDWIRIYTRRGAAGVFRVTNISQTYDKQIDLTLLHGIDILSDSVWAAQTDFSGTKAQFLTQLLNQQTQLINGQKPWVLGTCADTANYEKSINYDRLSSLLEELVEEGGDYYFTYDQSSFPWVINYVAKNQAVSSEFRLTRNVRSASVTYNDADLCTRLILSVNVKVQDEDTSVTSTDSAIRTYDNAAAQAEWGIVVKTADIDTKDDLEAHHYTSADAWAAAFLKNRAAPSVQIQIDGEELADLTGDTWDEYDIGRLCQVALPAYGHTFQERVVSVTYPNFLREPERVTVSLANTLPKFSENISSAQKAASAAAASARGAARGGASAKELTTWSQHVKYYGEALDGTGVLTLYESGIDMDAVGGVRIFSLVEGVQSLYADITVNANQISSIVQKTGVNELGANETLYTKITQTASDITTLANKTGVNSLGQNETLFSRITQNAEAISTEVGRASGAEEAIGSRVTQTETDITSLVQKTGVDSLGQDETLYSQISQNATSISSVVSKTGVNSLGQNETLYSKISQESDRIDLVVSGSGQSASIRIGNIVDGINGSAVQIDAGKIYLNGQVIGNSISAVSSEITNLKTGTTKATLINSDSVVADNLNGGTVGAGSLSIGSGTSGGSGTLYYRGSQYYRQGLVLGGVGGSIAEAHFLGDSSTTVNLDHYHSISAEEQNGQIVLTLGAPSSTEGSANFNIAATNTYKNGVLAARNAVKVNPFTANAATGATPDHRTFTYTTDAPTPESGTSQADTWYLAGGTSWNDNKTSVGLHYGSASGTTYAALTVDASDVYNAVSVGAPYSVNGAVAAGSTRTTIPIRADGSNGNNGTSASLLMQAGTYGSNSNRCINLNLGGVTIGRYDTQSIYDAGVTAGEGEFSPATVTPQGSSVSVTPILATSAIRIDETSVTLYNAGSGTKYDRGDSVTARPSVSSGGTIYYEAETAATYYEAGTATAYYKGDGSTVTGRGTSVEVTPIGTKYWYKWHASTETPTGAWYSVHTSNPGGSFVIRYDAGTKTTYYKGDGSTVTGRGTSVKVTPIGTSHSVTPIKATSAIRLGASGTYYKGDGGSFTPQGTSQAAYKKLTSGGTIYYKAGTAATYYQAGTADSTTYYTKNS